MAETKVEVPPVSNDLIAGAASQNIITDSKTSQQEESKISEMVTPEKVTKGPAVNGESQALDVKAVKNGHSQEADIQAPDAKTSGKDEQSDKPVPISAHERERKEHESSRVKVAKRWNNDQDRPRHSRYDNYSPRKPLKNLNKFDPVSLPESDDPVAIRKQVRLLKFERDACFSNLQRLSFTFRTPTSSQTSSCLRRLKATKTIPYR